MRTGGAVDPTEHVHNHGVLRAVPNTEVPNLTAQRNADESLGRAWRQLTTAAEAAGFSVHINGFGASYNYKSRDPVWVVVQEWYTAKRQITEHAADFVEALDRACDRLNREEWDR